MTIVSKHSKPQLTRKAGMTFRAAIMFFLILAISPLGCAPVVSNPNPVTSTVTRESATNTPEELPTTSPTPSSTATPTVEAEPTASALIFVASADGYVRESNPGKNFGSDEKLQVDGADDPGYESFIRFAVNGVSDKVQRALLRVYATDNGSGNGPAVYSTDIEWLESAITWNARPGRTSESADNKDRISAESWVEYDVTSLVTGNGQVSFVLAADSGDAVIFSSREGSQPPQLVITFGEGEVTTTTSRPTVTATVPPGSEILVGAGDIAECGDENDELTAQLLDGIPGTVFTTGDNVYDSGTATEYLNCYDSNWGRHRARTKPVPGNHEYRTDGAAGYFQYFMNVPSYYVYDLGSWRIYALNSEIDVSEGSSQIMWLQADLEANPSQCVLAYWHRPRWSSGAEHGSSSSMQTLWQVLYEAGADVVLNGHEHNYERFAPMDATGQEDPQGMREFVVGTGGKNHYDFGKVLPTSEVRDDTSFGVLKLILRPTGYDWEFIPVEGATFTDNGSEECH
jgi:acid phosphatase type 7